MTGIDYGEPISVYTDAQAVEDGNLVAVTPTDRTTGAVWGWLLERLPKEAKPPNGWPVDMMGWFRAKSERDKALAASTGLIGMHARQARTVYEENIGGGIFTLAAVVGKGGLIMALWDDVEAAEARFIPDGLEVRKLWLIPNEVGGVTLMFPEDY